jgi:hypothetical protein
MRLGIISSATMLLFAVPAFADSCLFSAAPPFQLSSDAVEWAMQIASGTTCTRGLKHGSTNITDVKLMHLRNPARSILRAHPFHTPQKLISGVRTSSPSKFRARWSELPEYQMLR